MAQCRSIGFDGNIVSEHTTLTVLSYNLHGLNQGRSGLDELLNDSTTVDLVCIQEHWQTPENLSKLNSWVNYYFIGSSAMQARIDVGPLVGRPFGGVGFLIHTRLAKSCKEVFSSDRVMAITIYDFLFICVYCPCAGTVDRVEVYTEVLNDIISIRNRFSSLKCVVSGDFNLNLKERSLLSTLVRNRCSEVGLTSCFDAFPDQAFFTYVNSSLNQTSILDYFLFSDAVELLHFSVVELALNYSDHLPIMCVLSLPDSVFVNNDSMPPSNSHQSHISYLRWDHADLQVFYDNSRIALDPVDKRVSAFYAAVLANRAAFTGADVSNFVDSVFDDITSVLNNCASFCVPKVSKRFFKFWWDKELKDLKEASVTSHRAWVAAGRPRSGPFFENKQQCRLRYRGCIRSKQCSAVNQYSNDLHDALLEKDPNRFWRTWNSKFGDKHTRPIIGGTSDPNLVVASFERYFKEMVQPSGSERAAAITKEYEAVREEYVGAFCDPLLLFNSQIVSRCVDTFKKGKACGADLICAEHIQFSHPTVILILSRLFNLMCFAGHVPYTFKMSYIVPLLKNNATGRSLNCTDFRGIAINTTFSKVFEKCLLHVFGSYFITDDCQFGFKQGLGCCQAISCVNKIVDFFVCGQSTASICTLDIARAFPSVNHASIFLKLMQRGVPLTFLVLLESWYVNCFTCVKWENLHSDYFQVFIGVMQGSCLAPALFAICMDGVINRCRNLGYGYIIVYADDIILISRALSNLQDLVTLVETELALLDLRLNIAKSACIRIGNRFDKPCASVVSASGQGIAWSSEVRYLGVFLISGCKFRLSFDHAKRSFNRAANCVLGKLGTKGPIPCVVQLLNSKCFPILIYGIEIGGFTKSQLASLDFSVTRFICKIIRSSNRSVIADCVANFGVYLPSERAPIYAKRFANKFAELDNTLCCHVSVLSSLKVSCSVSFGF